MIIAVLKNKLLELFPEANSFIEGACTFPIVLSCDIDVQKISSDKIDMIRKLLEEYKFELQFNLKIERNKIRVNVNFAGEK